jgi:thiol-disulfide isomerase/thioredoxin
MKRLIIVFFVLFTGNIFAQEINKIIVDPDLNSNILIGNCNRDGLKLEPFKKYFDEEYSKYLPDENIVKQLKRKIGNVRILIVMGSWCDDSRAQVPAFYNILDDLKFDNAHIDIIAVNRKKTAGDVDITSLNIERVPTFIFYRKYWEIGRIIEKPSSTLEKNMLLILSQE